VVLVLAANEFSKIGCFAFFSFSDVGLKLLLLKSFETVFPGGA